MRLKCLNACFRQMTFVLPGSPRQHHAFWKSQQRAGLVSEPVQYPATSAYPKLLERTPLTAITVKVKDFKWLGCATKWDLSFQTTKVLLNVVHWHTRWTPQQKALCTLACLLGRSLECDSAWVKHWAGKEGPWDNKLLQGSLTLSVQDQLQVLASSL